LVVIAIIGLLATLSIISLSRARANSRDTQRLASVKQIQTALELYFDNVGSYPATLTAGSAILSTTSAVTTTYMTVVPTAPTPADGSCTATNNAFVYSSTGSGYIITFCIGSSVATLAAGSKAASQDGIFDWLCGAPVTIAEVIGGHTCNTASPDYDTCTYNTVKIGTQCWMSQSLNMGTIIAGTAQTNNSILEKHCYSNTASNCQTYGALYQWYEMMQYSSTPGAQGICPTGWHIPTDAEQSTLETYLTDSPNTCDPTRYSGWQCSAAGNKLIASGSSGFNMDMAGYSLNGGYADLGNGRVWSSTVVGSDGWLRHLYVPYLPVVGRDPVNIATGVSVRCIKN
jgi:uncharacterized protein (TIGR02145 family)